MTHWYAARVPRRHQKHVEPTPEQDEAKWALVAMLGAGFVASLIGPRGCGKTQAAVSVIRHCCWRGISCRYWKALDLFVAIRDSMKSDVGEARMIHNFTVPQLLVIDESHIRAETPFEHRTLTHIIDRRYDAMRDTLLISNESAKVTAESLGVSIVDRMRESGGIIALTGSSLRGTGNDNA